MFYRLYFDLLVDHPAVRYHVEHIAVRYRIAHAAVRYRVDHQR